MTIGRTEGWANPVGVARSKHAGLFGARSADLIRSSGYEAARGGWTHDCYRPDHHFHRPLAPQAPSTHKHLGIAGSPAPPRFHAVSSLVSWDYQTDRRAIQMLPIESGGAQS